MWGIWLFRRIYGWNPHCGTPKFGQIRSNAPTFQHLIFWWKVNWYYQQSTQSPQSKVFHQFILRVSREKKCFCINIALLKTAVFQGFSHATSIPSWPAHRWAHGTMCLGPISPCKNSKHPHPGTQILGQIPEGGEGNRGQMLPYAWCPPPSWA